MKFWSKEVSIPQRKPLEESLWLSQIMSCFDHARMRDDTHMHESCPTHEWVKSHTRMNSGTHANDLCFHTWMSRDPHINESRYPHEWVMTHIWMSHGIHMNDPHLRVHHDSFACVPWLIRVCIVSWLIGRYLKQFPVNKSSQYVMSHAWIYHVTRIQNMLHDAFV